MKLYHSFETKSIYYGKFNKTVDREKNCAIIGVKCFSLQRGRSGGKESSHFDFT